MAVAQEHALINNLIDASRLLSSSSAITRLHQFRAVVEQGEAIVPELFGVLSHNSSMPIIMALKAITNEDPASPKDSGNVEKLAAAWIAWGKQRKE